MQSLFTTLPIFLIVAAGYILTRLNVAQNRWVSPLNNFVYYIALPALTILSLIGLDLTSTTVQATILLSILVSIVCSIIFAVIARLLPFNQKTQQTIFLTATLGNTIFLGIPLAGALTPSISPAIATTLSIVFFTSTLVSALFILEIWMKNSKSGSHLLHSLRTNPIIISLIIGLILAVIPIPKVVQDFVETPLQLIAQTASPLALFALGGFLAHHTLQKRDLPTIAIATILKLAVLPILFIAALNIFPTTKDFSQLTILMAATPTAVTAFVLAEKYKLDSKLAAGTILISTTLSIASILLILGLA